MAKPKASDLFVRNIPTKSFGLKLSVDLIDRIERLEKQATAAGFTVDVRKMLVSQAEELVKQLEVQADNLLKPRGNVA